MAPPAADDDDGAMAASAAGRFTETGLDEPLVRGSVNHERSSVESQRRSSQLDRRSSRLSAHDRASLVTHGDWQTFLWDSFALMFGGTQLGYAMGQIGWAWGSAWLAFSAYSTWLSGHLIADMVVRTGAGSFPELGDAAWGARGRWLVVALQWSGYYLGAVAQIAYMGASWDQTFRGQAWAAGVCQSQWMGVTALCLWPFMMVPSFTAFQGLALFSSLAAVFLTLVYLGQIAAFGAYAAGGGPCYDQWTTVTMLTNVCNMAFTFSGHGTFPEQIRELKNPRADFARAFDLLYAGAIPFYALCALVAFWAFGNANSAVYIENLRLDAYVHVALYATLVAMFPVIVLGIVVLLLQVELPLGVLPRDTLVNTSDAHETSRAAAAVRCVPPVVFRLVFRTLFLASMLFFAEMLIGAGLAFFANIAGALGLCATTYWLPYLLYFQLYGDELSRGRKLNFAVNLVGGLVISGTGTYYNVKDLFEGSFHMFKEESCTEGAYFWGNDMWDADLANTTLAYQTLVVGCCEQGLTCGN